MHFYANMVDVIELHSKKSKERNSIYKREINKGTMSILWIQTKCTSFVSFSQSKYFRLNFLLRFTDNKNYLIVIFAHYAYSNIFTGKRSLFDVHQKIFKHEKRTPILKIVQWQYILTFRRRWLYSYLNYVQFTDT